jgi:hypothetical protein
VCPKHQTVGANGWAKVLTTGACTPVQGNPAPFSRALTLPAEAEGRITPGKNPPGENLRTAAMQRGGLFSRRPLPPSFTF